MFFIDYIMFETFFSLFLFVVPPSTFPTDLAMRLPSPFVWENQRTSFPRVEAEAFVVIDAVSHETVLARSADRIVPYASMSKLMTAIVTRHTLDLGQGVETPLAPLSRPGVREIVQRGDLLTVRQLLSLMLVASANDAAQVLADAGGGAQFVAAMNHEALAQGFTSMSFSNPHGLDETNFGVNRGSVRDLALLFTLAYQDPELRPILESSRVAFTSARSKRYDEYTTNQAKEDPELGIFAGKTGTTDRAQECIVVRLRAKDRIFIVVLVGSSDRYTDLTSLINWLKA